MSFSSGSSSSLDGNTRTPTRPWTEEEDACLRAAIDMIGECHWKAIADSVPNRSDTQCFQRWFKVLHPSLKKGRWTHTEDQTLLKLALEQIQTNDTKVKHRIKWGMVSKVLVGRTPKQCRERWINNVDPSINKGEWLKSEDDMIMALYSQYPNKWASIAKALENRTEISVKLRYQTLFKRSQKQEKRQQAINTVKRKSSDISFEPADEFTSERGKVIKKKMDAIPFHPPSLNMNMSNCPLQYGQDFSRPYQFGLNATPNNLGLLGSVFQQQQQFVWPYSNSLLFGLPGAKPQGIDFEATRLGEILLLRNYLRASQPYGNY